MFVANGGREKKRKEKMEKRNDKENVSLVYVWRQGGGGKRKTSKITSCTSGSTLVHFSFFFSRLEKQKRKTSSSLTRKLAKELSLFYGALAVQYCKSNVVPLFLLLLLFEISLIGAPIVDLYLRLRHAWYCMLKRRVKKKKGNKKC